MEHHQLYARQLLETLESSGLKSVMTEMQGMVEDAQRMDLEFSQDGLALAPRPAHAHRYVETTS